MENEIMKSNLPEVNYNQDQIQLIKNMFAKGADDDEFQLLVYMSKKYRLDILTKQIWCVKYAGQPAQIYAGRDGFLEVGQGYPVFDGMETTIQIVNEPFKVTYYDKFDKKQVTFARDFQYVATCIVYRKDRGHPISVTVYESEYTTGRNLWVTKPRTMIGKVAESQALRKAFSISGLYAPEEMGQWEAEQNGKFTVEQVAPKVTVITAPKTTPEASKTTKTISTSDEDYEAFWAKITLTNKPKWYKKDKDGKPILENGKYIHETPPIIKKLFAEAKDLGIERDEFETIVKNMAGKAEGRMWDLDYKDIKAGYDFLRDQRKDKVEDISNQPPSDEPNTEPIEDITEAEFEALQEEFPLQNEVLIK